MLDYIWHSVAAQLGLAGLLIVGLCVAAYFLPPFRKWLLGAAGLVFGIAAIYAKGASDAKRREREKQQAAERKAVETGKSGRVAAKRDAARGVRDGYDRD